MSLVICSNYQDDYQARDEAGQDVNLRGYGSSAPHSFTNHFTNVFTIEKNSEVAVQSVKIERSSVSNVKAGKFFSVYLGPQLSATTNYNRNCILPIVVKIEKGIRGAVALGAEINKAFTEGAMDLHPDFNGNCSVSAHFQHLFAQQGFTGWKFSTNTSGNQVATNVASDFTPWHPCGMPDSLSSDYVDAKVGTARRITRNLATANNEFRYTMGAKDPLSLTNGIFEFRPFNKDGGVSPQMYWEVGLCRAVDLAHPAPEWCDFSGYAMTYGSSYAEGFMDYKLTWSERPSGKRGLIIEQALVDDDGGQRGFGGDTANWGQFQMVETRYFGVAGSTCLNIELNEDNCRDAHDASSTTKYYTRFRFMAVGEEMLFQAFEQSKANPSGTWMDVLNSTKAKALTASESGDGHLCPSSFKPINQNCWNMYPKIGLLEQADFVDVQVWGGRLNSGTFPVDNITPGTAYWARSWDEDGGERFGHLYELNNIRQVDLGLLMNGIHETSTYTRLNLDVDSEGPAYIQGILPQSQSGGLQEVVLNEWGVYNSILGNCANILGFPQQAEVMNINQGTTTNRAGAVKTPPCAKWVLYSASVPSFASQPAFIRCPTLTHQSLNMAKGLPSKILYQIPRFTMSSKEYGNLYFEPGEKTYLKLKNTEELNINELQIDIVNTDETYVDDLRGQTNVVLHFRKSRD